MVSRLLLAACLASAPAGAAALRAELDAPVVALGEPLTLIVTASNDALDALDITPLARKFEVRSRTLNRGPERGMLSLTLYARASGRIELPALTAGAARSQPLRVTILDGSDAVPRVGIDWTLVPARPLVNEPARLSLSVCDDGSLQWSRPALPVATGRLVQVRGEVVEDGARDGVACTVHRFDWSLTATRQGRFAFAGPMVAASRFGRQLRFPAPDLSYEVQPLPLWLPAEVPPVKPAIVQQALPREGVIGRPLSWRFAVTGGYGADALKALIERQLRDTPGYRFYPAELASAALDDRASPLTRFDVTLHVEPRQRGALDLPPLVLPWYDADSGRLASVKVRSASVHIVDPRLRLAGGLAGGAAGGLLLVLGGRCATRALRWRRVRRAGLNDIAHAPTLDALSAAVRRFSLAGRAEAPSLGAWLRAPRRGIAESEITALVERLERAQFASPARASSQGQTSDAAGRAGADLAELRQAFVSALARVRPAR